MSFIKDLSCPSTGYAL